QNGLVLTNPPTQGSAQRRRRGQLTPVATVPGGRPSRPMSQRSSDAAGSNECFRLPVGAARAAALATSGSRRPPAPGYAFATRAAVRSAWTRRVVAAGSGVRAVPSTSSLAAIFGRARRRPEGPTGAQVLAGEQRRPASTECAVLAKGRDTTGEALGTRFAGVTILSCGRLPFVKTHRSRAVPTNALRRRAGARSRARCFPGWGRRAARPRSEHAHLRRTRSVCVTGRAAAPGS